MREIAPEVLVVGNPEPSTALADRIRQQGYGAVRCGADAVVERLDSAAIATALVLCPDGLDVADVMRRIRDTQLGAAIVITVYCELGEPVRDLADVFDLGADHFLRAPATDAELRSELEALAGPIGAPDAMGPSGEYGSWPNRTEVIDGPAASPEAADLGADASADLEVSSHQPSAPKRPSQADQVLGQLHRTLDMLEQRLRAGGENGDDGSERDDDDLSKYDLDATPDVEGGAPHGGRGAQMLSDERGEGALGVGDFELPSLGAPRGSSRAGRASESTMPLREETSEVPMPEDASYRPSGRRPQTRREPLEPELEGPAARDRPRRARPLPIDRQGSLDVVEVPRLLWALHRAAFTGRLTLQHGKIEKSIWLESGTLVFARSNVGHDRLSDSLLRRGMLTRSQYEAARKLAEQAPRRSGQLLVEAGFLKPAELHRVLRLHLARIIDSTFPWRSGRWVVVPDERSREPILLEEVPARLLADGVRNRMDPTQLVDLLGGPDMVPRFDADDATGAGVHPMVELLRLSPSEEQWISQLNGRQTLAELTVEAGADQLELFGLVYLLHVMGYVALSREPEPDARPDLRPEELDIQRIDDRLKASRQLDYFEVLGLDRDACRVDVHRAYVDMSATFAADNLEPAICERMRSELTELREALAEARDVLVDDGLRSAYLAHLEEP